MRRTPQDTAGQSAGQLFSIKNNTQDTHPAWGFKSLESMGWAVVVLRAGGQCAEQASALYAQAVYHMVSCPRSSKLWVNMHILSQIAPNLEHQLALGV